LAASASVTAPISQRAAGCRRHTSTPASAATSIARPEAPRYSVIEGTHTSKPSEISAAPPAKIAAKRRDPTIGSASIPPAYSASASATPCDSE
jgi:hypothetical protein